MKLRVTIATLIVIAIAAGVFVYSHVHEASVPPVGQATTTEPVVHCDNDAKLCPDGSTVLRSGAQCEFALCPSMFGEVRNWQNRKDNKSGISFKYPATLGSQYVTAREWPPSVTLSKDTYKCEINTSAKNASATTTHEESYNNTTYCVSEEREGAAGSTYVQYFITFPKNGSLVALGFNVQLPQCMNYDGAEQSACQAAQKAFAVLELVDGIGATMTF